MVTFFWSLLSTLKTISWDSRDDRMPFSIRISKVEIPEKNSKSSQFLLSEHVTQQESRREGVEVGGKAVRVMVPLGEGSDRKDMHGGY